MFDSNQRRAAQPGRLTRDVFISRARNVHGDRYDYSQVDFVNTKTKVCIICPEHGPFFQSPEKHMLGNGCPNPACVSERRRQTNLAKYGVDHCSKSDVVKAKKKATFLARYGVENPMQFEDIKARHEAVCKERYGAVSPLGSAEIRDKIQQTMIERYGSRGAMHDVGVQAKARATSLARYGTDNPMQCDGIKQKQAESVMSAYGVRNVMQVPEIQERQRMAQQITMQARYGADSGFGSDLLRAKAMATNQMKYGVANVMKSDMFVGRMIDSKIVNGTMNISVPEDSLYGRLCQVFGQDNVVRQYRCSDYPFACDFYVQSRSLFIELNACWTHGGHWFNAELDNDRLAVMQEKAGHSSFYANAIRVWTESDVSKRAAAREHGLNYVVFWDSELRDADLWLAMGCPDGQDWNCEYSWLPERDFSRTGQTVKLTGTPVNLSKIAKQYQFQVFYAREIAMWSWNPMYRGTSLQIWLYRNRLKYLKKNPEQLTNLALMRGFTISGVMKGYTVFDTDMMNRVVQSYGIKSVYDPCAGWGERMLYCHSHGLRYFGVDINPALAPGYCHMIDDFGMKDQQFVQADSARYIPAGQFDAVITCPPYGDTEIYSEYGAENLSEDGFLAWWQLVVMNCRHVLPKYFCFQVNQKWRMRMTDVIKNSGFKLVSMLSMPQAKSSHFTRKNGVDIKKEFETMVVLKRI